jgi:Tfp pilus assembly protein PilV
MTAPLRQRRAGQRGSSMLEVLIAGVVLLVAFAGFVATAKTASQSNAFAHRRGTASYHRTGLLERYVVTARGAYAALPVNSWVRDRCFDEASRETASNDSHADTFTCPASAVYQTWIRLTGTGPWTLGVCAERLRPGQPSTETCCNDATRFTSVACVTADQFLSD